MRFRQDPKSGDDKGGQLEAFEKKYEQYASEMKIVFDHFFPEESKTFDEPSSERQYRKFVEITNPSAAGRVNRERNFLQRLSATQMNGLMGETAIRYLDDFIDDSLWPRIKTYNKDDLKVRFADFCNESVDVIKKYAPDYPPEIKELFLLELDLELEPTQENFDAKIVSLFNRKSLNMRYVESHMRHETADDTFTARLEKQLSYMALCVRDFSRDFEPGNFKNETDFNIRNYLLLHRIKPDVLITHIQGVEDELRQYVGSEDYSKDQSLADATICKNVIAELARIKHA